MHATTLGRGGRVAEGAPLLREYRVCSPIEGSNPSLSAIYLTLIEIMFALVAQLDRVPGYEPGGWRFESSRARHLQVFHVIPLIKLSASRFADFYFLSFILLIYK